MIDSKLQSNDLFNNIDFELLKTNEYYLFDRMQKFSLRTDDVKHGINISLFLLKDALNCGDVVLHRKDDNGKYVHLISNSGMEHSIEPISRIVKTTAKLTEHKGLYYVKQGFSDDVQNLTLMHIITKEHNYILSLSNFDFESVKAKLQLNFFSELIETMQIILKRAEMYEKNTLAINTDLLTMVDNRNSYENICGKIGQIKGELVYALFDLFRLKYINDTFSHAVGDAYIRETAKILKNYWPKSNNDSISNGNGLIDDGHCIYRIGGDEFALLTTTERLEITGLKSSFAAEEVSMLDLGIDKNIPLGLNYGIVVHNPKDNIKYTLERADKLLSDNKKRMYTKYGLDRRK